MSSLKFTEKLRGRYRNFPCIPCTHTYIAFSVLTSPTGVTHILQLTNLHQHILNTQSPQFTFHFTLGVVHYMSLDKCMTCIHYYGIIQIFLLPYKSSLLCLFILFSASSPWKPLIFLLSLVVPFHNVT